MRVILQEIRQSSITKIRLKFTRLNFYSHPPGASELTPQMPWDFLTSRRSFCLTSFGQMTLHKIIDNKWHYGRNIYNFIVSMVSADGLAPLGARTSASTMMNFCSSIHTRPALEGLPHTEAIFPNSCSWKKTKIVHLGRIGNKSALFPTMTRYTAGEKPLPLMTHTFTHTCHQLSLS